MRDKLAAIWFHSPLPFHVGASCGGERATGRASRGATAMRPGPSFGQQVANLGVRVGKKKAAAVTSGREGRGAGYAAPHPSPRAGAPGRQRGGRAGPSRRAVPGAGAPRRQWRGAGAGGPSGAGAGAGRDGGGGAAAVSPAGSGAGHGAGPMAFSAWQILSPVQWARWTWSAVRGGGSPEEGDGGAGAAEEDDDEEEEDQDPPAGGSALGFRQVTGGPFLCPPSHGARTHAGLRARPPRPSPPIRPSLPARCLAAGDPAPRRGPGGAGAAAGRCFLEDAGGHRAGAAGLASRGSRRSGVGDAVGLHVLGGPCCVLSSGMTWQKPSRRAGDAQGGCSR